MINIKKVDPSQINLLAEMAKNTYIQNMEDLEAYIQKAFSKHQIEIEFNDPQNIFYFIYNKNKAVGYAKLVLNAFHEKVTSNNPCRLERIYIMSDFIHLKIGQSLIHYVEQQAKLMQQDSIWLSVYEKNRRAIRFYEKNKYLKVGHLDFLVNETNYKNFVFSKKLNL